MPVVKFIPSVERRDKHFHGIYRLYRIYKQHFNGPFKIAPKFEPPKVGSQLRILKWELGRNYTLLCQIIFQSFSLSLNTVCVLMFLVLNDTNVSPTSYSLLSISVKFGLANIIGQGGSEWLLCKCGGEGRREGSPSVTPTLPTDKYLSLILRPTFILISLSSQFSLHAKLSVQFGCIFSTKMYIFSKEIVNVRV